MQFIEKSRNFRQVQKAIYLIEKEIKMERKMVTQTERVAVTESQGTERVTETERERQSQKDVCDRQSEIGIERVIHVDTDTETEVGKVKDSFLGKKN